MSDADNAGREQEAKKASQEEEREHSFQVEIDDDTLQEALRAVERSKGPSAEERVKELEAEVEAKAREAADWRDKALRAAADLENFRRRALKEKDEARTYGAENLLRDLLVILDNMDLALAAKGDAEQIKQGVKMTHDQFKQVLKQHGVEVIEATGSPFDPHHHEAVAHVPSEEHPAGVVTEEHRRGYRFRERLLRASMVSVSKGSDEVSAQEAPSADEGEESTS